MNLVIVESPSKSSTIEKYLGKDYKVLSSKGHIRDLSTRGQFGLGVNVEENFKPDYIAIKGKSQLIKDLKKEVEKVDKVYLATDPDREGEAISWHLLDALNIQNYERIVFNEITKDAVINSFKSARTIDQDLVNSQETRRIIDRIIGFRLSKLMQAKTNGKSAGRVQSVACKLIVDKEREIEVFIPDEYWTITAKFNEFESNLFKFKDQELEIKNQEETNEILNKLNKEFNIEEITKKEKSKKSNAPFITSTLQRMASNKLGFSARKTMSVAQKLYEGISLADETTGLISYMRTDSIRLSEEFVKNTMGYITSKYGKEYIGYTKISKKTDNVQDAHEAIRPTNINNTPELVKQYLTPDEFKLYRMIYYRALASLMKDAKTENTTIILNNNDYKFKTTGQIITFDGYLKVYKDYEDTKDTILPNLSENQTLTSNDIVSEQHFTKPPARYSEARLIEEMEKLGIGRPSTYAATIDTIKKRNYVEIVEKRFIPTKIGFEITDKLQECFSHIINVEYTAQMETDLDNIASGQTVWNEMLKNFYQDFDTALNDAFEKMPQKELEKTGEQCPNCESDLVIRNGKYGPFTACSNFPTCKYIKQDKTEEKSIIKCPNCEGNIIEKRSKRGKIFYGCNSYPKCKTAFWDKPIQQLCPECNKHLTIKGDKIKCSECKFTKENQ